MNILFIKHIFIGFMVSEIQRVSVFGHCPYSVTFPYIILFSFINNNKRWIRLNTTFKVNILLGIWILVAQGSFY